MQYPWYHGDISREVAEGILTEHSGRHPRGAVIYLVRKSGSSPKVFFKMESNFPVILLFQDFVITWLKVGDSIGNHMVKVMGAGSNCTYILDVTCPGKKTRYFSQLPLLLDHFQVRFACSACWIECMMRANLVFTQSGGRLWAATGAPVRVRAVPSHAGPARARGGAAGPARGGRGPRDGPHPRGHARAAQHEASCSYACCISCMVSEPALLTAQESHEDEAAGPAPAPPPPRKNTQASASRPLTSQEIQAAGPRPSSQAGAGPAALPGPGAPDAAPPALRTDGVADKKKKGCTVQ